MNLGLRFAAFAVTAVLAGLSVGACTNETGHTGSDTGVVTDPSKLAAPPAGEGVQMRTAAFDVPAGTEIQNCYFFKVSDLELAAGLPVTQSLNVHRVQIAEKSGSHHMNVFIVKTVVNLGPAMGTVTGVNGQGQCFNSGNWADWPLLANTQQAGDQDWSYPDGVANEVAPLDANGQPTWLMVQTHYVNASTQTTPAGGQVAVNLWTIPTDQVTAQIGTLFATDQSIRICQHNPTPTYTQGCQFNSPVPVTIVGANGHFHSRGTEFDMYVWDGTSTSTPPASERFYQSLSWNEPPMLHSPQLSMKVPAYGGIWYSCSYDWTPPPSAIGCGGLNTFDQTKYKTQSSLLDCCYTFGPIVDKNEHCNAFIYYYPKQDNVNCL
jgi:hypothetical protein